METLIASKTLLIMAETQSESQNAMCLLRLMDQW